MTFKDLIRICAVGACFWIIPVYSYAHHGSLAAAVAWLGIEILTGMALYDKLG